MSANHPAYQAIVDAALEATDANSGWLLGVTDDGFRVMAIGGPGRGSIEVDAVVPSEGARGYVLASGQPASLIPQPTDTANLHAGGAAGLPTSLLAIPCGDAEVVGVLEVSGKSDGAGFGFVEIESLTGLAHVASALLDEQDDVVREVPSVEQLSRELHELSQRSPARYASLAAVIEALLSVE